MSGRETAIRDAASLILVRRDGARPQVLMGQRGAAAVFMPDKFVFPGGALDRGDFEVETRRGPDADTARRLEVRSEPATARALPFAAVRELWEETGLRLGRAGEAEASEAPPAWRGFLAAGLRPRVEALRFVFRAVTPPGRPRRFDARFFLAEAAALADPPDDFSRADAELGLLQWIDLRAARALPLPFITRVVLAEVEAVLDAPEARRPVPFFDHDDRGSHFRMI